MELKQIKELMAAMGRTGTKRVTLKKEGFELELEREENGVYRGGDTPIEFSEDGPSRDDFVMMRRSNMPLPRSAETPAPLGNSVAGGDKSKEDAASTYVTSPMVGTYYTAPSPDAPPFVKVGDKIDSNTVVCIIEAMKVMNEVKAGVTGTVAEVLVETGHPVEFGTKLFRIS